VRELENVVERAVVLGKHSMIGMEDLPATLLEQAQQQETQTYKPMTLRDALEEPEKRIIEMSLRRHNWNRQETAEALGINRTTLYKKMKYYNLEADPVA
ncbi:MAG: hypothetical protein JW709_10140, partial [Sedimentisphaerales bacterium]|nr:hypothetical protein [Sedimentisphaerales bacterium]